MAQLYDILWCQYVRLLMYVYDIHCVLVQRYLTATYKTSSTAIDTNTLYIYCSLVQRYLTATYKTSSTAIDTNTLYIYCVLVQRCLTATYKTSSTAIDTSSRPVICSSTSPINTVLPS